MSLMDWIRSKTAQERQRKRQRKRQRNGERHYAVVRYYTQFAHGIIREVLGDDLTIDEAEALQARHQGLIAAEDIVIEDQNKTGLETEVVAEPDEPERPH